MDVRIEFLDFLLNSLADNMVRYASERLHAYHMVDSGSGAGHDLSRKKPALAKLGIERNDLLRPGRILFNVTERHEISKLTAESVHLAYLSANQDVEQVQGCIGERAAPIDMAPDIDLAIDEFLEEKVRENRRRDLDSPVLQPADNVPVGEGVELKEDFTHNADFRSFSIDAGGVELFGGL